MVVLNAILEQVKQYALNVFIDNLTDIDIGSDGTAPTISDTGVITLLDSALIESIDTSVAGQVSFSTKFGITSTANGDTVREISLKDNVQSYTRDLTIEKLKGSDQIFWFTIKVTANVENI